MPEYTLSLLGVEIPLTQEQANELVMKFYGVHTSLALFWLGLQYEGSLVLNSSAINHEHPVLRKR